MSGDGTAGRAASVAGVAGMTTFLARHCRRPTARLDGIAAWLRDEIEYLEAISRTPHGDGALAAYRGTLRELETIDTHPDRRGGDE